MLLPVDYLSPALAQKMARNGHLSALSQGVGASDAPAAFPDARDGVAVERRGGG